MIHSLATKSTTRRGGALIAQSGGPTAVINASACGVIQEALRQPAITDLFGANNGILGVLLEDLFDLRAEAPSTIAGLRSTPSAAVGSCRHKLGDPAKNAAPFDRILDVFRAHDIRYFFYIGGNDSMDTADKLDRLARLRDYELYVVGVPKTVDNDLVATDHCPGYGSTAKYLATSVMEAGRDTEAMYTFDAVTILEVMGRNTGWLAAAAGLARREPCDAPQLVYVPEVVFDKDRFLGQVSDVLKEFRGACIVVSEGIVDASGQYIAADSGKLGTDAFGHKQLGGAADVLKGLIERELGVKARTNKLGTCQRNAVHCGSATDNDEAYLCGQAAVQAAVQGTTGKMVALVRESSRPYRCTTSLVDLSEVANGVKRLPREFMDATGTAVTEAFREYALPLIQGDAPIDRDVDGLPRFVRFSRRGVAKRLPGFALT